LLSTPIPETLWHYTDLNGFRGIVTGNAIHATNLRYLNDREECEHAWSLARKILLDLLPEEVEECQPQRVRPLVFSEFDGIFSRGILAPDNLSLFTASFTLDGDQLSQWRGYSYGSAGISLGFDLTNVRLIPAAVADRPTLFAPCVYSDTQKEALLRRFVESYFKVALRCALDIADMPTVLKNAEEGFKKEPHRTQQQVERELLDGALARAKEQVPVAVRKLSMNLLNVSALLKHSAFQEEKEWRFVLPVFPGMDSPPEIELRTKSRTFVPYIQYSLLRNGVFPLKEVILGPGSEGDLAISAVRTFLKSQGLEHVRISQSHIPYRSW
jgi:hypothetical protein